MSFVTFGVHASHASGRSFLVISISGRYRRYHADRSHWRRRVRSVRERVGSRFHPRVSLSHANERNLRRATNTRASICSSTSHLNDDTMTAEHEHSDFRKRSRRTKSVTRAEEIKKAEQMVRRSQPDKPWVTHWYTASFAYLFTYAPVPRISIDAYHGYPFGTMTDRLSAKYR